MSTKSLAQNAWRLWRNQQVLLSSCLLSLRHTFLLQSHSCSTIPKDGWVSCWIFILKGSTSHKTQVNIPGWFSVAHLWCLSDGIHNGWGLSSQRTTHIKIFLRTAGGLCLALGTNDSVDSVNQKKKASWGTWVWKCRIRGNSLMVPEGPGSKHPELEPPMVCRGLVLFGFLCVCWDFM